MVVSTARARDNNRTALARWQRIGDDVERRGTSRFALRAPALFGWGNRESRLAGGFTRDASAGGAYILCEREDCPAVSTRISIEIMLPPIDAEGHGVKLKGEGQVVRNNGLGEESGFAIVADFGMHTSTSIASGELI